MKKIGSIIVFALIITSLACKKENKESKESRMDLITSGKWRVIEHTVEPGSDYDGDGDIDNDLFALYDECEKSMRYTFKRDGILQVQGGHSKCDTLGVQDYSLKWAFENNEKELLIERDKYLILELTSTRLKIRRDWPMEIMTVTFTQ